MYTVIPGHSQLSVEYTIRSSNWSYFLRNQHSPLRFRILFRPDRSLEALDYWLSGVVDFYGLEEQRMHRNTFFNQTIELTEKPVHNLFIYPSCGRARICLCVSSVCVRVGFRADRLFFYSLGLRLLLSL